MNIFHVKYKRVNMLFFLTVKLFSYYLFMVNSHQTYLPAAFDFPLFKTRNTLGEVRVAILNSQSDNSNIFIIQICISDKLSFLRFIKIHIY